MEDDSGSARSGGRPRLKNLACPRCGITRTRLPPTASHPEGALYCSPCASASNAVERMRRWRAANPERAREISTAHAGRWKQANPEKANAQKIVQRAVKAGKLQRQPCETCGATERIHAHHDDYSKPLAVVWLCSRHHNQRHQALAKEAA